MAKKKQGPIAQARIQRAERNFQRIRQWLGFGFCAAMLILFPLFLSPSETYFTITDNKFYFMQVAVILAFVLFLIAFAQYAMESGLRLSPKGIWSGTSITQKLVILSTLLWILSTAFSPLELSEELQSIMTIDSWVGHAGRFNGLRTYLLYALCFFLVVWCGLYHRDWVFLGFAAATIALSVIGILQKWGYNPFDLYLRGANRSTYSAFFSTVGNTNFVSGMLCLCIPFCAGSFVCKEDMTRWAHLVAAVLGLYLLLAIEVESGIVGMMAFVILFPILCCDTPARLGAGLITLGLMALTVGVWRTAMPSGAPVTDVVVTGEFDRIPKLCVAAAAALAAAGTGVWALSGKLKWSKKHMLIAISIVMALVVIAGIAVFVKVPFPQSTGFLYQAQQVLLEDNWDDRFGSNRLFIWKRTPELIMDAPLLGKGAASFLGAFQDFHFEEIFLPGATNVTVYDSAHNMYLDYAVEAGLLGLAAYLGILVTLAARGWKRRESDHMIPVYMLVAAIYCAQGLFSFMNVTIAPIFWVVLGLLELSVLAAEKEAVQS